MEEAKRDDSATNVWIMRFTGGLVLVGLIQAGLFIWQLRLINKSAIDSTKAANAAQEAVGLAREEFISTHRPKLIVRRVSLDSVKGIDGLSDGFQLSYVVANTGDTPATVIEVSERLWLPGTKENLPPIPPYSEPTRPLLRILGGSSHTFSSLADEQFLGDLSAAVGIARTAELGGVPEPQREVLFLGYVRYRDERNTIRTTAFLRRQDTANRRFIPIGESDYEYQD